MVLVGALVGASRVRTVRSVMFASENWVRETAPTAPLDVASTCSRLRDGRRGRSHMGKSVKEPRWVPEPWRAQVAAEEPTSLQAIWRFYGDFSQSRRRGQA